MNKIINEILIYHSGGSSKGCGTKVGGEKPVTIGGRDTLNVKNYGQKHPEGENNFGTKHPDNARISIGNSCRIKMPSGNEKKVVVEVGLPHTKILGNFII